MAAGSAVSSESHCLLAFDGRNRLAVRREGGRSVLPFVGADADAATRSIDSEFKRHTAPVERYTVEWDQDRIHVSLCQVDDSPRSDSIVFRPLEQIVAETPRNESDLAAVLQGLDPYLAEIPYLHLGDGDFIFSFRPAGKNGETAHPPDAAAQALYQSRLCAAIRAVSRQQERSAGAPRLLDFGPVRYLMPSHFGFCLGVRNAIERAYDTLAENPGRRVFMLSELIHNPFVNEDLRKRGLRYLQTDRGVPYTVEDRPAATEETSPLLWDTLKQEDIVVIPAFGATNEDKARLVRKGLPLFHYDATCMLVEKVWRAARAYGREGYTIVIHGKHEHEETRATYSNARRYGHAVIVRDMAEARQLGAIIESDDPAVKSGFFDTFSGRHTPGFDPAVHLGRVAVVNQTTLLMNETVAIIEYLQEVFERKFGDRNRVGGGRRRDTLCYATQVNQDALARALAEPLDAAFVVGGRNSSNSWQLYRLCERSLGKRAFFIPSESAITGPGSVEHTVFGAASGTETETRPLWPEGVDSESPKRILLTGGASCPDGVLQQVLARLNSFFPADRITPVEDVLRQIETAGAP